MYIYICMCSTYAFLRYTYIYRIGLCRYVCVESWCMSICTVDTMPVALTLGIGSLGHDSEKVSLELLIEPLRPRQERETRQILYRRWDGASIRPDNRIVLDLLDQGRWSFQCLAIQCTFHVIVSELQLSERCKYERVLYFRRFLGLQSTNCFKQTFWVWNFRHCVCLGAFTWTTHYLSRFASCLNFW